MADLAPRPLIPARRPREVIDVDALDDDVYITGVARRSQRPRLSPTSTHGSSEAGPSSRAPQIIVLDSDEEMTGTGAFRRAPVRRRHRLRSPPPRHLHPPMPPPPVPPLPANFNLHNLHPPIVVPNANPLPFEAGMNQGRRRHDSPRFPTPRASPRSHHQPVMGLGGALITLNRQNELEEQNRRARQEQAAREARATNWRHRWITHRDWFTEYAGPLFGEEDAFDPSYLDENTLLGGFGQFFGFLKAAPKPAPWKPSYTHSDKPPPGFTYNFDASDQLNDKGSSSSKAIVILDDEDADNEGSIEETATLVCACCLDRLVLSDSLDEEESRRRRVWALRCGHMLDGKCAERLMRPAPPPVEPDLETKQDGHSTRGTFSSGAEFARLVRKGKGKAVDRSQVMTNYERLQLGDRLPEAEDNSIRSRLRSSRIPSGLSAPTGTNAAPISPHRRRGSTQTSPGKPTTRGKGRRARKLQPLETCEFKCPVASCERVHRSLLMPGEDWKMDPAEGAVALFV